MQESIRKIKIDKSVPIPLYYQLKCQLLDLLNEDILKPGEMLPAEPDMCNQLMISRPTIRQALAELVDEGYLVRFKGKGTFITKPKVRDRFLSKLESFNDEMRAKGMVPHTKVLAQEEIPGNPDCNSHLQIPFDQSLLHLCRVRYADEVPMVYLDTYLPFQTYQKLLDVDFTYASLYEELEKVYGIHVTNAHREIEAVPARKKEAEFLEIAPNKPICFVRTVSYVERDNKPVEYSLARYRGDRTKFEVETYR
ncbi:MAG: GntR family transcriptional regulator [Clostridia bacterium]